MRFTDQQEAMLLRHGHVLVPNFLTPEELAAARENMARYFPSAEELAAQPERYPFIHDDPEHLQIEFPFAGPFLNRMTTHPEVLSLVSRLLRTEDILLSQSALWAKYAGTGDFEQGLHLDYQGNTLVVPCDDGSYRQVNLILYYSDAPLDLGPTFVVSQEKTKQLPLWPTHRTRKKDPGLYKDERPVLANAGDLLIFSMRTWHRASAITADQGVRLTHHMVWRAAAHQFQGYHHWPQKGEDPALQEFIATCEPAQRHALGFPKPGDPYWNDETLAATQLRYPELDMAPYRKHSTKAKSKRGR